jgi:hypothetical protein
VPFVWACEERREESFPPKSQGSVKKWLEKAVQVAAESILAALSIK